VGERRWVAVTLHVSLAIGGLLLAVAGGLTASAVADVVTTTVGSTTASTTTTAPVASTTTTAPTTSVATVTTALQTTTATAGPVPLANAAGSPPKAVPGSPRKMQRHATKKRKRVIGMPLRITPPLGVSHEVFPVVGTHASFSDTYGALRTDVAGNWHHGDDIFAPIGTPVVAVADGTIDRVGWNQVGGWRLWLRDDAGDEFYYAHLAGYTQATLRAKRVLAGEVIGFVGNTGDAITTPSHLHFEIHPSTLLHLGYNGAVDPTRYLEQWTHLDHVHTPKPAHPPLPAQSAVRAEARRVWRELLSARHLVRRPAVARATASPAFPPQMTAARIRASAPTLQPHARASASPVVVVLPLALLAGLVGVAVRYRRRRTS
jgi:murein DD-endopeptidase MepM/ murein hydrolase activator NlpD